MTKILAINPGSTSTKIGYYEGYDCKESINIRHEQSELSSFNSIVDQYPLRREAIFQWMAEKGIDITSLNGVVGRGGLLRPTQGGTFLVNASMIDDLKNCRYGVHASNLGALLAEEIAKKGGTEAYIVDPVTTDEMEPLARYSGHPEIKRVSVFHALNQKASAHTIAEKLGQKYEDLNMIIAHLGGGTTVGAHKKGRTIDVSHGLEEGPFTPERSGALPTLELLRIAFSGKKSHDEIKKMLVGKGGMTAYLGSSDMGEIVEKAKSGSSKEKEIVLAMAYQIAKEIGSSAAVLSGKVDAIVLTGGVAHNSFITDAIKERVSFIAPVHTLPGENELLSMTSGVLRVLNGDEKPANY